MIKSIADFGARPGPDHSQTASIQRALDSAAASGGGTVVVPAGEYRTGTLSLSSHVTLHLENGAVLKGSPDIADYPPVAGGFTDAVGQRRNRCLIYAKDTAGTVLSGTGCIDGNGGAFGYEEDGRPFMVRFINCQDVQVTGITLKDSPGWVSHYLGCENILIHGVTIRSRTNGNNDGMDIDSCRRVRISDCDLDTGDDAICIKATRAAPSEDILVTGCRICSTWGALKLGTESAGDFRNILFSNIVIRNTEGGGIKLISMDGCRMENVVADNILMDNVSGPIFIRLGARLRRYFEDEPEREVGCIRGIELRNIRIRVWEEGYPLYGKLERKAGVIVTGVPGHPVEDVLMENVRIEFPGGEEPSGEPVPEQESEYPEFPCFHPLPSWALFLRHARGLVFRRCRFTTRRADARPPVHLEDVAGCLFEDVSANGTPVIPSL